MSGLSRSRQTSCHGWLCCQDCVRAIVAGMTVMIVMVVITVMAAMVVMMSLEPWLS